MIAARGGGQHAFCALAPLRLADRPDEVHATSIARLELAEQRSGCT